MEDTLSSPYPARMVTFLVQGTPVTLSEDIILEKCPYSKLADIASYSLPGETATIDCPLEEFNELIEYLKTGKLDDSDEGKLDKLLKVFRLLEVPIPEFLKLKLMSRNSEASTSYSAAAGSSSQSAYADTGLPSYDSVAPSGSSGTYGGSLGFGKIQTEPLTIQQKIALAVEDRLTNLLMEHILPLVESQATSGIYNGAFILVPSNSTTLQNQKDPYANDYDTGAPLPPPDEEVVGLSISNISLFSYMKLVRLQGAGNTVQFLMQRQVIEELTKQLKARLQLPDPPAPPPPQVVPLPVSPPPVQKKSRWGWGRSSSQTSVEPMPAPVAPILPPPVSKGPIDIRVEEVSMRRMNFMGIYETTTGTVLVVEIFIS
ncbi:hypothetical protein TWF481_007027 [Arthrobotrys musiformis]|uniref:Potassium channel tetramerisation-type BTB domain-containing protein n=1 Tax=Arthrobotrys musiformis TaxID=47236 RepID=A0AAV9WBM7_9PEZI